MAKRKVHSENHTGTSPPRGMFDIFISKTNCIFNGHPYLGNIESNIVPDAKEVSMGLGPNFLAALRRNKILTEKNNLLTDRPTDRTTQSRYIATEKMNLAGG